MKLLHLILKRFLGILWFSAVFGSTDRMFFVLSGLVARVSSNNSAHHHLGEILVRPGLSPALRHRHGQASNQVAGIIVVIIIVVVASYCRRPGNSNNFFD